MVVRYLRWYNARGSSMYSYLKTFAKKIIPQKILFENKEFFRLFYGLFYTGSTYKCNICNQKSRKFLTIFKRPQQCPRCGSLARTRRLYHLLTTEVGITGTVLDFSPARCLYRKLKKNLDIIYHSTDFENEFLADYRYDITDIPIENQYFDRIICYHILEHITDDTKAMRELYRVLKPDGKLIIQTPYKEGAIYKNPAIVTPEERLEHFGQEDHVRIYSIEGLSERLKIAGFKNIEIKNFLEHNAHSTLHQFEENETVFVVQK